MVMEMGMVMVIVMVMVMVMVMVIVMVMVMVMGRWLVLVLSLLELWCGVVWMNIVSWNNCTLMLAGYPLHWLIFGFLLLASATCWMRTLQKAGRMSILAALALCVAV